MSVGSKGPFRRSKTGINRTGNAAASHSHAELETSCHVNESCCSGSGGDVLLFHVGLGDQLLATSDLFFYRCSSPPVKSYLAEKASSWIFVVDTVPATPHSSPPEGRDSQLNGPGRCGGFHNWATPDWFSCCPPRRCWGSCLAWEVENKFAAAVGVRT